MLEVGKLEQIGRYSRLLEKFNDGRRARLGETAVTKTQLGFSDWRIRRVLDR